MRVGKVRFQILTKEALRSVAALRGAGSAPHSLLNRLDDGLGYWASNAMRRLGERLRNRKTEGKELSISRCLRGPDTESNGVVRPRGRRI